jgi:hypothetical protein
MAKWTLNQVQGDDAGNVRSCWSLRRQSGIGFTILLLLRCCSKILTLNQHDRFLGFTAYGIKIR